MSFDIRDAIDIKKTSLLLDGWYPLTISYGLYKISEKNYLLWQVYGVNHTFSIPLKIVMAEHGGNYKAHFEITLKKFKEDLLEWVKEGLVEDWMKDYHKQYKHLIKNQL